MTRLRMTLMLVPILLDCVGSSLIGESFMNTLSAKAHDTEVKKHPRWGWTAQAIDCFFGKGHCKRQWDKEQEHGSVWAAWLHEFKSA